MELHRVLCQDTSDVSGGLRTPAVLQQQHLHSFLFGSDLTVSLTLQCRLRKWKGKPSLP